MQSKTAWKLYGLVLATFALGKEELREYLSQNTSIITDLSEIRPTTRNIEYSFFKYPAIDNECKEETTSIVSYQKAKSQPIVLPSAANQSMDILKFAAKKTALKALEGINKEVTTKVMELALDSCKR